MHVETLGAGPRLVLVHGSVAPGWMTWSRQKPLAERFTLVVPIRSGYPPNPPLDAIDFEQQADDVAALLREGDHLAAHSYGAVVALLATARRPEVVRSLTVIEPPAYALARGHPAVEEFLATMAEAPREPRAYLEFFLPLVGTSLRLPAQLGPELEGGARAAIAERPPHEATIPLETLALAPFPKLVVSGAHNAAFDAVCDVLEERLGAQRAVLPGAGHAIPRLGEPLNELLAAFARAADVSREESEQRANRP